MARNATIPSSLIYANGINGSNGQYLLEPVSAAELARQVREGRRDGVVPTRSRPSAPTTSSRFLGLSYEINPTDVRQAGWGIVFGQASADVRKALAPLIEHRRRQIPSDRCKVLEYRPGEQPRTWLARYRTTPGNVVPTKTPCYLLLVGDPTDIPFDFQYLLDVEYAVGRLCFDRPEQYRQYAESVVSYETSPTLNNRREVVYFGTKHDGDLATQMSAEKLITPLANGTPADGDQPALAPIAAALSYRSRCCLGAEATKATLGEILRGGKGTPALLFSASHGMGFAFDDAKQRPNQGALLCQDWPGPGSIGPDHYFAAADLPDDAKVGGLVAFHFACYGAGTPGFDNFLMDRSRAPMPITKVPFVAALPQRMLSHPNGGALAVVGHVERAWSYSFDAVDAGAQIVPFRNFIGRMLAGEPVGHATKDFNERYAMLSAELASKLDVTAAEPAATDDELIVSWIERNDAQNYALLGDPAVRLRVDHLQRSA